MPRAAMACSVNTPVPCGQPAEEGGRCAVHRAEVEARRPGTSRRGYGSTHQRARDRLLRGRRAAWRAYLAGDLTRLADPLLRCPRCFGPIPPGGHEPTPDEALHADHFETRPPADPDRLAHADCNVRAAEHRRGPQV